MAMRFKNFFQRSLSRLLTILVAAFLIAGCNNVDLLAVQVFASETNAAKESFDNLSEDWLGTCIRRTEYMRVSRSDLRKVPEDSESTSSGGKCATFATFADDWRAKNDLLIAYVEALGALAGLGSTPRNVDQLSTGLSAVGTSPAEASAYSDLAAKISAEIIAGQQRRYIGLFARENDSAVEVLVRDLSATADRYDAELSLEGVALDGLFRDTLRADTVDATESASQPTSFEVHRLDIETIREEWERRRAALRLEHRKVSAYKDALRTLAQAHDDIVARANTFSRSDLASTFARYSQTFGSDLTIIAKPIVK